MLAGDIQVQIESNCCAKVIFLSGGDYALVPACIRFVMHDCLVNAVS